LKLLKDVGELEFIRYIARQIEGKGTALKGIGDDAAVVSINADYVMLFTADMLVEGVHFLRTQRACSIGHKAISCSLSDIAAMGATPKYALITLGLPKKLNFLFAKNIFRGILKTAKFFNVEIIGGDTVCSEKIIIDVFVCGTAKQQNVILRSGAKYGDCIFVTGSLGNSQKTKHLHFTPRVEEANFLTRNFKLNAMIDVSDGLICDLNHILKASKVGALLEESKIPLSKNCFLNDAYYTGEEFELLFTLPEKYSQQLISKWPFKRQVRLSCIGRIMPQKFGLKIKNKKGIPKKNKIYGYNHF